MLALVMTAGLAADISMDRWRTHYFLTFPEWALLLQVVYLNIGAFTTWHFRPAASGEITRHDASVTSRRILRLNSELLAVSGPNAFIASAVFFVGEVPFMRSFGSHIRDRPTSIFPHVLNIGAAVFDAHFVTQPKFVVDFASAAAFFTAFLTFNSFYFWLGGKTELHQTYSYHYLNWGLHPWESLMICALLVFVVLPCFFLLFLQIGQQEPETARTPGGNGTQMDISLDEPTLSRRTSVDLLDGSADQRGPM